MLYFPPEEVIKICDVRCWIKIIIYCTIYNSLRKPARTTFSWIILHLINYFWLEKSKLWATSIDTISQARCVCVSLAFSWSQNLGWAQCLYLTLVQSSSVAVIHRRRVRHCPMLNCNFLHTGYRRSMPNMSHTVPSANYRQSDSAIIGEQNRKYDSISNGKPPNVILLGNQWTWQEYYQCGLDTLLSQLSLCQLV